MFLRRRVIPVMLIENDRCIKTIGFKNPIYIGDPINTMKIFMEKGIDEFLVLDRSRNEAQGPNFKLLQEISGECFVPVGYGGGIYTLDHIQQVIAFGFEKVVLNSALTKGLELIEQGAAKFGKQSMCVSVDFKKDWLGRWGVYAQQGRILLSKDVESFCLSLQSAGAGEIILQAIAHDGKMSGYCFDFVNELVSKLEIPIVLCGGAGNSRDLMMAFEKGAQAAAAASMFVFWGKQKGVLIQYQHPDDLAVGQNEIQS